MASVTSAVNSNTRDLDPVVLVSTGVSKLKRAVAGTTATASGVTPDTAAIEVGTNVDDAAFVVAGGTIGVIGALADETAPDSVDEGDAGALRMTLDRMLQVVTRQRASTPTQSTVAGSNASVQLLASTPLRLGATITNDSSALCYIKLGTTASTSSYTVVLAGAASAPFAYYEVPFGYTGRIDAIWASTTGNARITELTA